MRKVSILIRRITLILIIFTMLFLCMVRLIKMQVVEGESYLAMTEQTYTATQDIIATRGQIFDNNGVTMTSNKAVYKVIMQKAFLPSAEQNDIIFNTLKILREKNEEWNDSVPISMTEPFEYTENDEKRLLNFKSRIIVNPDATVENCVYALGKKYSIDAEKYSPEEIRLIGGVRFEMEKKDFSYENRFTLADDISLDTVMLLKEMGIMG